MDKIIFILLCILIWQQLDNANKYLPIPRDFLVFADIAFHLINLILYDIFSLIIFLSNKTASNTH